MARKTTIKKRSQKSSASQKKQRVRKSTSAVKANSSFNLKSISFALLLLITLAALLINTLPMFQENTENLIGRAVGELVPKDIQTLDTDESTPYDSVTWTFYQPGGYFVELNPLNNEPTGRLANYDASSDKLLLSDGSSLTVTGLAAAGDASFQNPADFRRSKGTTDYSYNDFSTETDLTSIGSLDDFADRATTAARTELAAAQNAPSDAVWKKGTDEGGNEYYCPSADNCWWKKSDGSEEKVKPEGVNAVREVLGLDAIDVPGAASAPDDAAGDTSNVYRAVKGTGDDKGYYLVKKGVWGTESALTLDDYDYIIAEEVHQKASRGGYEIVEVKELGTGLGDDVEVVYQGKDGSTRVVHDYILDDGNTDTYVITEEFNVPATSRQNPDGGDPIEVPGSQKTVKHFYNGDGEYMMDYDTSQTTPDGKQVVNFKNSNLFKDTRFAVDPNDLTEKGACKSSRACYSAVNNKGEETGAKLAVSYGQSTMDSGYAARINEYEDDGSTVVEEWYPVSQRGKGIFAVTTSRSYSSKKINGKYDEEKFYETTNGARSKIFMYETVGGSEEKHRVFYEKTVEGTFIQNKRAVSQDNSCVGKQDCTVYSVFEDESGDTIIQPYVDENNNGFKDSAEKSDGNAQVIASTRLEDSILLGTKFDENNVDCGGDSGCEAAIAVAKNRRSYQVAFGATATQQTYGQILGAFTSTTLQPVSSLLCGGGVCAPETVQSMDQWFAGSVFSTDYYESYACKQKYEDLQAEGVAFSDNGQNVRGVGTANADVSGPQPVLCDLDQEENDGCPENHYCQNDLCYNEETDEVAQGYLYYITWGVTAPQDEAQTVYINENGFGVSYNIVLSGDKYAGNHPDNRDQSSEIRLYSYEGNDVDPLVLYNGETDGQKLVHMSLNENLYKYICIDWAAAPRTVPNPVTRQLEGDPNFVPDICNPIEMEQIDAVNLLGGLVDSRPSSVTGGSSETQQSVTTETIQTNADW